MARIHASAGISGGTCVIAFDSGAESGESKKRRKKRKATQPPSWIVQEVINRVNDCITAKAWPGCAAQIAPLILKASQELHEGKIWLIDRQNPNLVHNYFYERKVS